VGVPGRGGQDADELAHRLVVGRVVGKRLHGAHEVRLGLGVEVDQPEAARALRDDVEPPVRQLADVAQHRGAADRVQAGEAVVVGGPALPDGDDAELAVGHGAGDEVDGELPVPRFEDVQWQRGSGE